MELQCNYSSRLQHIKNSLKIHGNWEIFMKYLVTVEYKGIELAKYEIRAKNKKDAVNKVKIKLCDDIKIEPEKYPIFIECRINNTLTEEKVEIDDFLYDCLKRAILRRILSTATFDTKRIS